MKQRKWWCFVRLFVSSVCFGIVVFLFVFSVFWLLVLFIGGLGGGVGCCFVVCFVVGVFVVVFLLAHVICAGGFVWGGGVYDFVCVYLCVNARMYVCCVCVLCCH